MILPLYLYSLKIADTPVIKSKRGLLKSKQSDCDEAVSAKKIKKSVTFSVSYSYSIVRNSTSLFLHGNYSIRNIIFIY